MNDPLKSLDQLMAERQAELAADPASFPQKESSKEKLTVNSLLATSLTANSYQDSRPVNSPAGQQITEQQPTDNSKPLERERNRRLIRNMEIEQRCQEWVMIGLTEVKFVPWVAKCCHTLGVIRVNELAINAKNGKTPDRLFASLLKGAMQLQAKQEYERLKAQLPLTEVETGEL